MILQFSRHKFKPNSIRPRPLMCVVCLCVCVWCARCQVALIRAVGQTNQRPNAPTRQQWGNEPTSHQLGHRASSQPTTDHRPNNQQVGYAIRHQASGIEASAIGASTSTSTSTMRIGGAFVFLALCGRRSVYLVCVLLILPISLSLSLSSLHSFPLSPSLCLSLSLLSFSFVAVAVGNFLALLTFHFVGMENFILHYCKGS